ncbi:hypothetical protein HYW94_03675 [Candidatus Uhrbacteria bacterium]|nr:hypothetical protein [Candidatus Uhrbacteria bacterium]
METGGKNKIIKFFETYHLSKNSCYSLKCIRLTKKKIKQKYFVSKIARRKSEILSGKHALNLKSYLSLIIPADFHRFLPACDFFYLIRGEEKEAFSFFKKNGCGSAIVIKNKQAKKRFEKFLIGYNKQSDTLYCGIYNIASIQRMRHYELLLIAIYGKEISKKLYKTVYQSRYFKKIKKIIQSCFSAKKIIIGYKDNTKRIIKKFYKQTPDIDIEDDYFSLSYYKSEKLIITGHAFGWMMGNIVSLIVQLTKIDRVFYIGNCGALSDFKIGRIIFPNNLSYFARSKVIIIDNILNQKNNYSFKNHLSVPTPLIETNDFIIKNRKIFSTVDVELYDIVKNILHINRNVLFGVALLVSDRPNRKENCALVYNEYFFQRSLKYILEKVTRLAISG